MGMTNTNQDYAGECDPSNDGSPAETNPNLVHQDDVEELDEVKNVSDFANGIYVWHTSLVNQCIHVVNMPEHQADDAAFIQVKVTAKGHPDADPETNLRILKEEEIPAFKAGVQYALDMLVELPFKFLPTDADNNVVPEYASQGKPDAEKELS